MIVVGKISIKAILENKKRDIDTVYILDSKKDKETRYILSQCKGQNVKRVSREYLDKLTGVTSHGGFAIDTSARKSDTMESLMKDSKSILCVEGLTDPFNMGEILRTITVLGFDGFITPKYEFFEHEAKLIRASAGASEKITWVMSDDLGSDLKKLKAQGTTIISAHRQEESISLVDYKFDKKVCVCLGGALRGLSKDVLDQSDQFVRLDTPERIALSTQGAASVFAYARLTQSK